MIAPRHARAFSLLELLVAIALLALLSAAVYGFMWHLFDRESRALVLASRTQTATVLFDRLQRDLLTAVAATPDGPGVLGEEHELIIYHRSVLAGGPDAPIADLQRTTVRFEHPRYRLILEREDAAHVEHGDVDAIPDFGFDQSDSEASYPKGLLTTDIRALRIRYHDGRSWRSSFSSSQGLPVAVEVALWFSRGGGDPEQDADTPADAPGLAPEEFDPAEEFGARFDFDPSELNPASSYSTPTTPPDRLRIIVIPDARDASQSSGGGGTP